MSIEIARSFFLWCSVINIAILLVWAGLATLGRDWLYRLSSRWFRLSPEQFDMLNLTGITLYKTGVLLFNIVPCISLYLVR
ncbi:MAG: DUF6868 family protein [Isosphaeraceae bacterium]|jgi:uncharacterized protein DUF6868